MLQETKRNKRIIKIANKCIGGNFPVLIQSMCDIKTEKVDEVVKEIIELENIGCEIIRVSIVDEQDILALAKIKKQIHIPLVADIHFDYKLAIKAIENGADKIRINPGNIGSLENVKQIIGVAKKYDIPIRIGVNSGSIDRELENRKDLSIPEKMCLSIKKYVEFFEKNDFHNIVLSAKSSNVKETIEVYELLDKNFDYPIHLGVTEAGPIDLASIKSSIALGSLLLKGIGDTIRVSINGDLKDEIIVAKKILHECGLLDKYPTLISCPTCGRTMVDTQDLVKRVNEYLVNKEIDIKVAIMGCVVNGVGEGKHADIGLAGGNGKYTLFKKGQIIKTIDEKDAYQTIIEEIEKMEN